MTFFGLARDGRDHVAARQRARHQPPAGAPRGTEDDDVHGASNARTLSARQNTDTGSGPLSSGREARTARERPRVLDPGVLRQRWPRRRRGTVVRTHIAAAALATCMSSMVASVPADRCDMCGARPAAAIEPTSDSTSTSHGEPALGREGARRPPFEQRQARRGRRHDYDRDDRHRHRGQQDEVARHPEQVHAQVAQRQVEDDDKGGRQGSRQGYPVRPQLLGAVSAHGGILSHRD